MPTEDTQNTPQIKGFPPTLARWAHQELDVEFDAVQLATMRRFQDHEQKLDEWNAKAKKEGREMIARTHVVERNLARAKDTIDELSENYQSSQSVSSIRLDTLEGRQTELKATIEEIETRQNLLSIRFEKLEQESANLKLKFEKIKAVLRDYVLPGMVVVGALLWLYFCFPAILAKCFRIG